MANVTLVYGLLLIAIGAMGYTLPENSGQPTALIPAYCGAVFCVLGFLAKGSSKTRKIVMHIAVVLGLLLIVMTGKALPALPDAFGGETLDAEGNPLNVAGIYAKSATCVLSILYVGLCVRSFIAARRSGGMGEAGGAA